MPSQARRSARARVVIEVRSAPVEDHRRPGRRGRRPASRAARRGPGRRGGRRPATPRSSPSARVWRLGEDSSTSPPTLSKTNGSSNPCPERSGPAAHSNRYMNTGAVPPASRQLGQLDRRHAHHLVRDDGDVEVEQRVVGAVGLVGGQDPVAVVAQAVAIEAAFERGLIEPGGIGERRVAERGTAWPRRGCTRSAAARRARCRRAGRRPGWSVTATPSSTGEKPMPAPPPGTRRRSGRRRSGRPAGRAGRPRPSTARPSSASSFVACSVACSHGLHPQARSALHDRPVEQPVGADGMASSVHTLAPPPDSPKIVTLPGVATEAGDVVAHPLERRRRGRACRRCPTRRGRRRAARRGAGSRARRAGG